MKRTIRVAARADYVMTSSFRLDRRSTSSAATQPDIPEERNSSARFFKFGLAMVNVPGRSKGCFECRRRKLKCNEAVPECEQCVKKGLLCSGARTGALFVHALPAPPKRHIQKHISVDSKCQADDSDQILLTNDASLIPPVFLYHQPSRADIFDHLFVSHFIESFGFKPPIPGRQLPTWLDELGAIIVSHGPDLVKHSIRAASMYFYGTLAQDVSIRTEACRWYSTALRGLQSLLSQKTTHFTGDVICATVMLTHFENLAGTSGGAWFQHVQGAAMMLETCGPEGCRDGFLHQLFRHLRLLTFVAAIFRNEQHAFASPAWITVPFETHPKTAFDQFVDILFSMLPCLSVAEHVIKSTTEEYDTLITKLNLITLSLMSQLHTWWMQCISIPGPLEADADQWQNASNESAMDQYSDPNHFPLLPHTDMPTAALGSLYDAASVVVLRLLYLVSPSAYLYEDRIQRHVQSIQSAKRFIAAIPSPASGRGTLMVELPLQILDVWNPAVRTEIGESQHTTKLVQDYVYVDRSTKLFGHVASYIHQHNMGMS